MMYERSLTLVCTFQPFYSLKIESKVRFLDYFCIKMILQKHFRTWLVLLDSVFCGHPLTKDTHFSEVILVKSY